MITNHDEDAVQIPSSDVLRLVQSHLTECGLHAASSALRRESGGGVGLPGLFPSSKGALVAHCRDGRWGEALSLLENLDLERIRKSWLEDCDFANNEGRVVGGGGGAGTNVNDDGQGDDPTTTATGEHGSGHGRASSAAVVTPLERAVAMAHEMTVLELAEKGESDLAYAALRMCTELLDRALRVDDDGDEENDNDGRNSSAYANDADMKGIVGVVSSRSGDVERRVTALCSARGLRGSSSSSSGSLLPADYYGGGSSTRQKRRDRIARAFKRHLPEIPPGRLVALLQQSVKWQCHTGSFPTVQRLFRSEEEEGEGGGGDETLADDDGGDAKKKKRKKRKNKTADQKFDLVLGNVDVDDRHGKKRKKDDGISGERILSRPHRTIRLGKRSHVESACFLPDGRGLVTGSSDGFVEVWGERVGASSSPPSNENGDGAAAAAAGSNGLNSLLAANDVDFERLRTSDLPYQRDDDMMTHDSAVLGMDASRDGTLLGTTSSDGTVCVWKVSDGKLLRNIERAHGGVGGASDGGAAVTCIQFSPDGSKILTGGHDSTCREFGLLASRMLKEFRGHRSYVNCCAYVALPPSAIGESISPRRHAREGGGRLPAVVTASADGTVRLWDGRSAELLREISPPVPASSTGTLTRDEESVVRSRGVHSVFHLRSPANAMIVVPRCDRAYLMSYAGDVMRTYARDDVQGTEFLAAVVGPSGRHLFVAADDGKCVAFDVRTGKVEKIVRSFAEECSGGGRSGKECEISGMVCHPHRGLVGGYSSDKGQKRGILTLWK